jgi:hypothetical protein
VIDIQEHVESGHEDWLRENYDIVGVSHLRFPAFGGPYVWIRRKSDGRLELAR